MIRLRAIYTVVVALLCAVLGPAVGAAQSAAAGSPPDLPGPPPGAGSGISLPPPPGQAPAAEPNGSPATIPASSAGPGLLSGSLNLHGTQLNIPVACTTGGRVSVSAPSLGTLAQGRYRCVHGRAVVRLSLQKAAARSITRIGEVLARLAFAQGTAREHLTLALGPRVPVPGTWMSYSGLACNTPGGGQAQLLAPNFTDTPATTIDVRPWLAYYTDATGWQWIGTGGANASSWYRWTATPAGVAEWQSTPTGTIRPWTWGPISISPGRGTYVIAVFEVVYWYSHPVYVWRYARSSTAGNPTTYCAYP